jgi:hypothetical protein
MFKIGERNVHNRYIPLNEIGMIQFADSEESLLQTKMTGGMYEAHEGNEYGSDINKMNSMYEYLSSQKIQLNYLLDEITRDEATQCLKLNEIDLLPSIRSDNVYWYNADNLKINIPNDEVNNPVEVDNNIDNDF